MTGERGILEASLLAVVERHQMLSPGDRVLVALSGGQDSLALLHCLHRLAPELRINLRAAHLHHGIRGAEADQDQQFVADFCARLGVPLTVEAADVPALVARDRLSVEQVGRRERYAFLRSVATRNHCRRIALAHTATDRAETVLMNILRGAGLEGLRGIPAVNGEIIRPLIDATRDQTAEYCRTFGLQPRHDRTNEDTGAHLRNRVRLQLMPLLARDYSPGIHQSLLRLADVIQAELDWTREAEDAACEAVCEICSREVRLRIDPFQSLPEGLARRVVRRALEALAGSLEGFSLAHVDGVAHLALAGKTGGIVTLPGGLLARREYQCITLLHQEDRLPEPRPWQAVLLVPGVTALPCGGLMSAESVPLPADPRAAGPAEAYLDAAAVGSQLLARGRQPGDRIEPVGMAGSRKLQDIMVDRKIPRQERDRLPVVLDNAGCILWAARCCVSRAAALNPHSQSAVRISWTGGQGMTPSTQDNEETGATRHDE